MLEPLLHGVELTDWSRLVFSTGILFSLCSILSTTGERKDPLTSAYGSELLHHRVYVQVRVPEEMQGRDPALPCAKKMYVG